jgi:hypothetical protein
MSGEKISRLNIHVKKVIRTSKNAVLITVSEWMPDDWQFVYVTGQNIDDRTIQLTLRKVEVQTNGIARETKTDIRQR